MVGLGSTPRSSVSYLCQSSRYVITGMCSQPYAALHPIVGSFSSLQSNNFFCVHNLRPQEDLHIVVPKLPGCSSIQVIGGNPQLGPHTAFSYLLWV